MLVFPQNKSKRIIVWHEGALGDLILSRLSIGAIRGIWGGKISLYARHEIRNIFLMSGLVDEAFPTSFNFLSQIKRDKSIKSVILFASSKILIETFQDIDQEKLICLPTRPTKSFPLALEQLFTLTDAIGLKDKEKILKEALKIGRILKKPSFNRVLLLHPGSGGRWKCAPLAFTISLFKSLKDLGFNIRFILGPAEKDLLNALSDYDPIFCNDIKEAVSILSQACGFIGYDSGLTHLAAAFGIPVIAIFGPTAWWHWTPFGKYVLIIYAECNCLRKRLDPKTCIKNCLTRLSVNRITFFISDFLKHFINKEINDKYQENLLLPQTEVVKLCSFSDKLLDCLGVKVVRA